MNSQRRSFPPPSAGFTLVELMVSVSIIGLIMLVLLGMTNQISATWRSTTGKIEEFQQARNAFESMTRKLSQATLNTFWVSTYVVGANGIETPTGFRRNSELRFACGPMSNPGTGSFVGLAPNPPSGHSYTTHGIFFQAPFGYVDDPGVQDMANLLNTWGFFIDVANDSTENPPFLAKRSTAWPSRYGYRLTEFQQSTEKMSVYNLDNSRHDAVSGQYPSPAGTTVSGPANIELAWFLSDLTGSAPPTRVLAENIIALIIWPKLAKQDEDYRRTQGWCTVSPYYIYDSSMAVNGMFTPIGNYLLNYGAGVVSSTAAEIGGIDPKNQLPPVVQVTMVALDAASGQRLLDPAGNLLVPVNAFTQGLFAQALSPPYPSPQPGISTQYDLDMKTLEANLTNPSTIAPVLGVAPLRYRIFTTNVSIRGAKWSSYETN